MKKKDIPSSGVDVVFSQSALRLIEEFKISKDLFKGRDFVGAEDVRSVQRQAGPDQPSHQGDIEFQKISLFKKREIEYLSDVQSSNLSNVVSMLIDVTSSIQELNRVSKFFKNSLLLAVLSELPALLQEYPEFNA